MQNYETQETIAKIQWWDRLGMPVIEISIQKRRKEGENSHQHPQATLKCKLGINIWFESLGIILSGFQLCPLDF